MEISKEIYERLQKYPYLCNLCLNRIIDGENCLNYDLVLEFCDFPNYSLDDKIVVVFFDVQNLKIQNLDGLLRPCLMISDLRDRQLENIKYYVKDCEEEMFSFYCSSIEVR